jgi:hypothetical protein
MSVTDKVDEKANKNDKYKITKQQIAQAKRKEEYIEMKIQELKKQIQLKYNN